MIYCPIMSHSLGASHTSKLPPVSHIGMTLEAYDVLSDPEKKTLGDSQLLFRLMKGTHFSGKVARRVLLKLFLKLYSTLIFRGLIYVFVRLVSQASLGKMLLSRGT